MRFDGPFRHPVANALPTRVAPIAVRCKPARSVDARACFLRQTTRNEEKRRKAGVTKIGAAVAIAAEKSGTAKETLQRKFLDSLFYM